MEVGGRYIVSYGCNNPAGLANDAGDEHANVMGEGESTGVLFPPCIGVVFPQYYDCCI